MKKLTIYMLGILSALSAIGANNEFFKRGSLVYNEDNENYFVSYPKEKMTREALREYVGHLAGGNVTHFFMNPNGQRTSYRTKVSEAVWDDVDGDEKFPEIEWSTMTRLLWEKGIDPYAVWTEKCREIGISPWVSLRVNDQHFSNSPQKHKRRCRILNFWRRHPELRRVSEISGNWCDNAFDFSHKEVRDYKLALVREFFDNWDVDGIEIDWMRTSLNLTPSKERENSHFITEFMRGVRKIADEAEKKRGHKIGVAVRVPIQIGTALNIGFDVDVWAKEGLIDAVIASQSYQTYFDVPCDSWKKFLSESSKPISFFAACDHGILPYSCGGMYDPPRARRVYMDMPLSNGWAANSYYRGADGLYTFNMMYTYKTWIDISKYGLPRNMVVDRERRHPAAYIDNDLLYGNVGQYRADSDSQFPQRTDSPVELKIQCGKIPPAGKVSAVIAFDKSEGMGTSEYTATLNGEKSESSSAILPGKSGKLDKYGNGAYALRFDFPLSAACDGYNSILLERKSGAVANVIWAEIDFSPENSQRK